MDRPFDVRAWGIALLAVAGFSTLAEAQTCVRTPVSVAIKNVTVAGGAPGALARGMAISVGTPAQDIAFMPLWFNNSFVYDSNNLCTVPSGSSASAEDCVTWRGGSYNPFVSSTQKQGNPLAIASDPNSPSTKPYTDTLTLNKNTQLASYTFGVPLNDWGQQYYRPQAMLGLGSNSTFLNGLKAKGLIASRSWSIFWGRTGRDRGQRSDGNVVFGGYDKSKVEGTANFTQKLNYTNCEWGTSVELSFLGLVSQDGKTTNLFNSTSSPDSNIPLWACIDPSYVGVAVIPYYDYFSNFVDITDYESFTNNSLGGATIRSVGYNFWDLLYLPGDKPFLGDLNVTIKGGPSIRITNKELVTPHVYMDQATHTWKENGTLLDLRINANPDSSSGNHMTLGRNALTFIYLLINQDAGTFTVWPAFGDSTAEDLQAVDEKNNPVASYAKCDDPANPGGSDGAASSPKPTDPAEEKKKGISAGAIAGIAVGGVAIVALVILGILFFIRRGKKKQQEEQDGAVEPTWTPPGTNDASAVHEVGATNYETTQNGVNGDFYAPKPYAGQGVQKPAELGQNSVTPAPGQAYHEMPTN